MRWLSLVASFTLVLSACAHRAGQQKVFVGVIVSVHVPDGVHYSLAKGPTPLTVISVRLRSPRDPSPLIRLAMTDLYSAKAHGSIGDTISFRYSDPLPFDGVLAFDDVDSYHVVEKRG